MIDIQVFNEKSFGNEKKQRKRKIREEIQKEKDDKILNVNKKEYLDHIEGKYSLQLPEVNLEETPVEEKGENICLHIPYSGNAKNLKYSPQSSKIWTSVSPGVFIHDDTLEFNGIVRTSDSKQRIQSAIDSVKDNFDNDYTNLSRDIEAFNDSIKDYARKQFENHKEKAQEKLEVVREDLTVRERLIESLEREGVSRRELIRKFDQRIPALIINYTSTNKDNWLKDVLNEKYDSVGLSGGERVIPPDKVPEKLLTEEMTIDEWIEQELFEGQDDREAVIVHASLVDLRYTGWEKNTYAYGDTIEQRITVTDYLEDEFYKLDEITNSIEHIEQGDIGFLASKYVTDEEMERLHENQNDIEKNLGNPSIKELANEDIEEELIRVLKGVVDDPQNVAEGIIFQASVCKQVFFEENTSDIGLEDV